MVAPIPTTNFKGCLSTSEDKTTDLDSVHPISSAKKILYFCKKGSNRFSFVTNKTVQWMTWADIMQLQSIYDQSISGHKSKNRVIQGWNLTQILLERYLGHQSMAQRDHQ